MNKPETPSLDRKLWLLGEKERLKSLLRDCIDEGALKVLRGDYRAINDELSLYYDDIPLKPIKS